MNEEKEICSLVETEIIQRLNYNLIFGFNTRQDIMNSTFLCNRDDDNHVFWELELIRYLLQHKIRFISNNSIDLELVVRNFIEFRLTQKKNESKSLMSEWKQIVSQKADADAYLSFNYDKTWYNYDYYQEPVFNGVNLWETGYDEIILLYHSEFVRCYEEYKDDYENS